MKKFEIGQRLHCGSPYGGELCVEVVDRNEQFIFYHYTEECSDNSKDVHVERIIPQEDSNGLVETIEAWDYEGFKSYYWADQKPEL